MKQKFVDKTIQCAYCPNVFVWSAGEQGYFNKHGLTHEPRRCPDCRKKKQADPNFAQRKTEYVKKKESTESETPKIAE